MAIQVNDIQASGIMATCSRIELHEVVSSNVRAVGYDKDESILLIEYHDGSQTAYTEVDRFHYRNILTCGKDDEYPRSVGAYLRHNICGKYDYMRIKYAKNDWRRIISDFINQIEMPGTVFTDGLGHDLRLHCKYIALKGLVGK